MVVTTGAASTYSRAATWEKAAVKGVEIQTLGSCPARVCVVVTGELGDPCTTIATISQTYASGTLEIIILTRRPAEAVCVRLAQGFRTLVPLDVAGLEPGVYAVSAHGVTSSFELKIDDAACSSDADCRTGYSCWREPPRGPFVGIPGTTEEPGRCWDEDVLPQIR